MKIRATAQSVRCRPLSSAPRQRGYVAVPSVPSNAEESYLLWQIRSHSRVRRARDIASASRPTGADELGSGTAGANEPGPDREHSRDDGRDDNRSEPTALACGSPDEERQDERAGHDDATSTAIGRSRATPSPAATHQPCHVLLRTLVATGCRRSAGRRFGVVAPCCQ